MKTLTWLLASAVILTSTSAMARKTGQTRDEAAATSAKKFRKIDTDGDDKVSLKEYAAYAAKTARKNGDKVDQAKVDRRFKRIDTNDDGFISAAEELAYDMARFDKADANGNGVIDEAEAS